MFSDHRRAMAINDGHLTELGERSRIGERAPQFRMLEGLPIVARLQLGTLENLADRGDRCDQYSAIERNLEQFRLSPMYDKIGNQPKDPLVFFDRFLAAREQSAVSNPVLVAGGGVT